MSLPYDFCLAKAVECRDAASEELRPERHFALIEDARDWVEACALAPDIKGRPVPPPEPGRS